MGLAPVEPFFAEVTAVWRGFVGHKAGSEKTKLVLFGLLKHGSVPAGLQDNRSQPAAGHRHPGADWPGPLWAVYRARSSGLGQTVCGLSAHKRVVGPMHRPRGPPGGARTEPRILQRKRGPSSEPGSSGLGLKTASGGGGQISTVGFTLLRSTPSGSCLTVFLSFPAERFPHGFYPPKKVFSKPIPCEARRCGGRRPGDGLRCAGAGEAAGGHGGHGGHGAHRPPCEPGA